MATADEVVVAVHPSVPYQSITRDFARALFGMRVPSWPDGSRVTVFVLPDRNTLHETFAKQVLAVFPRQLRSAWDRQVFSGTGTAPIELSSEDEMLSRIAETPGGIGYVEKLKVDQKSLRTLELR